MIFSDEDLRRMELNDLINELCNFRQYNVEEFRKLSDYVAVKQDEDMASRVRHLTENIGLTNKWIKNLKDSIDSNTDKMIESNDKFLKSQKRYLLFLTVFTFLLFIASLLQAWTIYWTSRPERTIEMIQALDKRSDPLKDGAKKE